jgi:S1-C subfamily serine protease
MRFVLTSLAGREWVKGHPPEAKALLALTQCEDLAFPVPAQAPRIASQAEPPKLPAFNDDERRAAAIRPGWIGITFVPVSHGRRERLRLPGGAATVTSVLPRSPAAEAGLRRGDIVAGTPGRPLAHARDLRPFIVAANLGAPLPLEVLRGGSRVMLTPVVREAPVARTNN